MSTRRRAGVDGNDLEAGAPPRPVLYLATTTLPVFADSWILSEIIRRLDRGAFAPIAACSPGRPDAPTPLAARLSEIPDLEVVPADLGPDGLTADAGVLRRLADMVAAARTIARLAWLIRRRDIRIVHVNDRPRDAVVAVVLSRLTRVRCLVHVHQAYRPGWTGRPLRWALGHADGVVAISTFVGRTLTEGGLDPVRVHVVRNGIDLAEWHPGAGAAETRAELGIDPSAPVLLTICRLFPEKGPLDAIEAVARLRAELPDIQLLIVGNDITGGRFTAELDARVAELQVAGNVRFLGRRDDIEGLMAACDIYVMPSFEEPFGLVFCEAMAMERPVVALADGGTVEVVDDGRTGLLVTRGDLDALTAHLRALLLDPARRTAMGAAGRADVAARFTTTRMAADAGRVYSKVAFAGRPYERTRAPRGSHGMRVLESRDVDEFRAALDNDGYVVIPGVVAKDRLTDLATDLTNEYERLKASNELFEGGGSLSGHLNCFPGEQSRFIWDDLAAAGIPDLVREVRPDIADSVRATLNFNLPGSVAQHYHMDGLYLGEFLICNVAVVDTDLHNGAIDVLPGTNREFWKFWRYALHRLYKRSTRLPLDQGDVVVRKSTLWHRGMPNHSSAPRPMMAITFGEMDDLDADPFMQNDGKPEFFPNWYATDRLGRLREQTFVKAPITYSAWRFTRSLYGNKGYASF
jgi:glycosyltransferase involved in cell wall biosynthesis